jgi:hypothetical protein
MGTLCPTGHKVPRSDIFYNEIDNIFFILIFCRFGYRVPRDVICGNYNKSVPLSDVGKSPVISIPTLSNGFVKC